ncbi:MAG TPA: ABC transporter ATP-binding protein [Saprospiraceae bacterium]|nr:ABC transporter ATP-binding protein [Saprospiraceae bacterium]HMQ85631.1 ABC transporter ATP-binding protein [Saprospiraceae bacterium]
MITIRNLHKAFGNVPVLQGIDLEFSKKGTITAILGPNGSGKTTLIKSLLGMVIPGKGLIEINGIDVRGQWEYRAQIDYLPQIARFPDNLTVSELIAMIKDLRNQNADDARFIQLFGLEPYLDKRLGNLSGGTQQKVNLTLAFMYDSPILILDEPSNGLDPVAMLHFRELISEEKQKGKIILITTHIMSLVEEMADEVVFLLDGKVYFHGTVSALKEQQQESSVERAIAAILNVKKKHKPLEKPQPVLIPDKAFSFNIST